jgi:hypothetical protein
MTPSSDPTFDDEDPEPEPAGERLSFGSWDAPPEPALLATAAQALGRPVKHVDPDGYDQELIAASFGPSGEIAYVTCASKDLGGGFFEVSTQFRVRDAASSEVASEIESYNPYFGCNVCFLEWFGTTAVLIYREKHETYIAVCSPGSTARYKAIADQWIVNRDRLGYWIYKEPQVRVLTLPTLDELAPMSEAEASGAGLCPDKFW